MVKMGKKPQDSRDWRFDATIIGAGPSGLSLACALGAAGLRVACLEKMAAAQALHPRPDGRTLALSARSARVLERAGVWPLMARDCCPIRHIHVADQDSDKTLSFRREDGSASGPFGWIVETQAFQNALLKRTSQLAKAGRIEVVYGAQIAHVAHDASRPFAEVRLEDGRKHEAPLVAAADGRRSRMREEARIPSYGWSYGQSAVVCALRHEMPHDNIAVEHFQPGGPFAVLPMTDDAARKRSRGRLFHRSSIVWTETTAAADALMKMEEARFVGKLQDRVRDYLGDIELAGERFSYPLSLQHARRYVDGRLVLVGDAAHGIHPIAGQGFNLGMGDIEELVEVVVEAAALGLDAGACDALKRYERARRIDNEAMVVMTDGLTRLFSNAVPPVQFLRRFGLDAVDRLPGLKRAFVRQAEGA